MIQYYIHEYEGNNPDKITGYFDKLIFDITYDKKYNSVAVDPHKNNKYRQFFTSIDSPASSKSSVIIKILINKAFLHCITTKNETTPPLASILFAFNTVT